MKNRGYAASCRVKRETQITELKVKKTKFFYPLQNLSIEYTGCVFGLTSFYAFNYKTKIIKK